jgi:hypothetical protein
MFMKKKTIFLLVGVTALAIASVAIIKNLSAFTADVKECCQSSCVPATNTEEKKTHTGLIFWDSYSTQLLQLQGVPCN